MYFTTECCPRPCWGHYVMYGISTELPFQNKKKSQIPKDIWRHQFRITGFETAHLTATAVFKMQIVFFFPLWLCDPTRVMASLFLRFLDHTQRRSTVSRFSSGQVLRSSHRLLRDNTQHSQQTNIHAPGGIRTHDLSRREAADLRLRPRGHWDRQDADVRALI